MWRPEWWEWEIEITPHAEKRMVQRNFTEIDLRKMLDSTYEIQQDMVGGRWVVKTQYHDANWEVIVEPDYEELVQVIITAYSTGE
jgi:Domain of unknown function (DUF4258)